MTKHQCLVQNNLTSMGQEKNVDMSNQSTESHFLMAIVPYSRMGIPDEVEIVKTVRQYANQNWFLIGRSESEHSPIYGNFTQLKFAPVK